MLWQTFSLQARSWPGFGQKNVWAGIGQRTGHDTARAILEGLAAKLDPTGKDEKQALLQLSALINALPEEGEQEKSPVNPKINRASLAWRNRRDSNPR
jgi:hypothetical protein